MTVVVRGRSRSGRSPGLWTWVAVALVPIGLAAGLPLAFLLGERDVSPAPGLLPGVVALAAPVVAVVLAARTARDGHRSGPAAAVVSGLLLLATLVALPTLVNSAEGFLPVMSVLGLAALVATTGVAVVRSHGRHRTS